MKQPSDRRLAANRANAAKSTGPRTPEGKARAARNSRKHGLAAAALSIVRLEDQNELENLKADAVARYLPRDSQELFAVERIAICQLAMIRGWRLEAGMFITCLNICLNDDNTPIFRLHEALIPDQGVRLEQNRNYAMAEGFHMMVKQANDWSLLLRYQAQAERQYRRAVEDFERLKRERPEFPNEPISDPEVEETAPDPPAGDEPIPEEEQTLMAGPVDVPAGDRVPAFGPETRLSDQSQVNVPVGEHVPDSGNS